MKQKLRQAQEEELVVMAKEEREMATQMYGHIFESPMEGLGVLQEEIYEAAKEWRSLLKEYEAVQFYLCEHQTKAASDCVTRVRVKALMMARELIQVAAMCEKFKDSEVVW